MSDAAKTSGLDAARARLEAALSALTQGVASSRDTLNDAADAAHKNTALSDRITALEAENLKLHEQVAAYALQPEPQTDDTHIKTLQEENAATTRNYQMLKQQYAVLQDELEARNASVSAGPEAGPEGDGAQSASQAENTHLKELVATLSEEKNTVRAELDKVISELEAVLEEA